MEERKKRKNKERMKESAFIKMGKRRKRKKGEKL